MYTVSTRITGVSPLMQHRYPIPELATLSKGGKKSTGSPDYTQEWRNYMYTTAEGELYQPAAHIEAAMIKAAVGFKVSGKRGKSYKDLFQANVFVEPDRILHGVNEPQELDADGDKPLYLDVRHVVVQRSRVVRIRPTFKPGWQLAFTIQVNEDEIQSEIVNDVLVLAGKTVGIGDYRPRFGRFMVTEFTVTR